jgi:hypothetical protein
VATVTRSATLQRFVSAVTFNDERSLEDENLIHTPIRLIAVVDDERVDTNVDAFQSEVKVVATT